MKIDWDKVWRNFEAWRKPSYKDWGQEREKIQSLVEAQMKKKNEKKAKH